MKNLLFIFLLAVSSPNFAQSYKITYLKSSNGSLLENQDAVWVFAYDFETSITTENIQTEKVSIPFEFSRFDRKKNIFYQFAILKNDKHMNSASST